MTATADQAVMPFTSELIEASALHFEEDRTPYSEIVITLPAKREGDLVPVRFTNRRTLKLPVGTVDARELIIDELLEECKFFTMYVGAILSKDGKTMRVLYHQNLGFEELAAARLRLNERLRRIMADWDTSHQVSNGIVHRRGTVPTEKGEIQLGFDWEND